MGGESLFGALVGDLVGTLVGNLVGTVVGDLEGALLDGFLVGTLVGLVGAVLGFIVCTQLEGHFPRPLKVFTGNNSYWSKGLNTFVVLISLNPQVFLR
jgi:uncharacterized membrane protein YeaQ/YmgE (transglycosylase-associated protein family)